MRKLSKPMEDMVKGAVVHHVQVDGEIVRSGYIVAGNVNTVVALMERGVCTTGDAVNHGLNWLTDDGMKVWESLTGKSALLAIVECAAVRHYANATSDDVEIAYYLSPAYVASKRALLDAAVLAFPDLSEHEFNDLFCESYSPGDLADIVDNFRADRDAAMSEDHLTVSDMITDIPNTVVDYINTELDERLMSDDRDRFDMIAEAYREGALMILTHRNVIVSQSYIATMARIAEISRDNAAAWKRRQADIVREQPNLFALIDADLCDGKIGFGEADKEKRRIRKIIRPTLGCKHKPSKNRR